MRQQRRNTARGNVPFKPLATAPDLPWSWAFVDSTHGSVTIDDATSRLQLAGVPQFDAAPFGGVATAATLTGNVITLTFGSNINADGTLTLPTKDPALRSSAGSYLAASTQNSGTPGPAAVQSWGDNAHPTGDVGVADLSTMSLTWQLDAPTGTKLFFVAIAVGQFGNQLTVNNSDGSLLQTIAVGGQNTFKWIGTTWQIV